MSKGQDRGDGYNPGLKRNSQVFDDGNDGCLRTIIKKSSIHPDEMFEEIFSNSSISTNFKPFGKLTQSELN
jgi:hypothetical protein